MIKMSFTKKLIFTIAFLIIIGALVFSSIPFFNSAKFGKKDKTQPPETTSFFNADLIDKELAYNNVATICKIAPRNSGTDGAADAAALILNHCRSIGLKAELDMFADDTPKGRVVFRNIMATIPGAKKEVVVLVSHFDTKDGVSKDFCGANDSGSSTGLLLELARVCTESISPPIDIIFAFVDGEECMVDYSETDGLHGSRRLAERLIHTYGKDNIRGVIVLDMIGDADLGITLPRNSAPSLIKLALKASEEENARRIFKLSRPIIDDHLPFLIQGVPAITLIDFEYGSKPGLNDYWHTPQDTMDKISADSLLLIGRISIRMLNSIVSGLPNS